MEDIIKKAIEGEFQYPKRIEETLYSHNIIVTDPLFWQALEKVSDNDWRDMRRIFFDIHFEKSWDEAVEYLQSIIK